MRDERLRPRRSHPRWGGSRRRPCCGGQRGGGRRSPAAAAPAASAARRAGHCLGSCYRRRPGRTSRGGGGGCCCWRPWRGAAVLPARGRRAVQPGGGERQLQQTDPEEHLAEESEDRAGQERKWPPWGSWRRRAPCRVGSWGRFESSLDSHPLIMVVGGFLPTPPPRYALAGLGRRRRKQKQIGGRKRVRREKPESPTLHRLPSSLLSLEKNLARFQSFVGPWIAFHPSLLPSLPPSQSLPPPIFHPHPRGELTSLSLEWKILV